MTPQEKYDEWRKGCTCAGPMYDKIFNHPSGTTPCEECEECTNALILSLAEDMRKVASKTGPLHCWWDVIFDMEEFTKGRHTIVNKSAVGWIEYSMKLLKENNID